MKSLLVKGGEGLQPVSVAARDQSSALVRT